MQGHIAEHTAELHRIFIIAKAACKNTWMDGAVQNRHRSWPRWPEVRCGDARAPSANQAARPSQRQCWTMPSSRTCWTTLPPQNSRAAAGQGRPREWALLLRRLQR